MQYEIKCQIVYTCDNCDEETEIDISYYQCFPRPNDMEFLNYHGVIGIAKDQGLIIKHNNQLLFCCDECHDEFIKEQKKREIRNA